jgi:hypothetical protein
VLYKTGRGGERPRGGTRGAGSGWVPPWGAWSIELIRDGAGRRPDSEEARHLRSPCAGGGPPPPARPVSEGSGRIGRALEASGRFAPWRGRCADGPTAADGPVAGLSPSRHRHRGPHLHGPNRTAGPANPRHRDSAPALRVGRGRIPHVHVRIRFAVSSFGRTGRVAVADRVLLTRCRGGPTAWTRAERTRTGVGATGGGRCLASV